MFPITQETQLFAIHRRHVGASQTADIAAYTLAYNTYNFFVTTVAVSGTDVVLQALANALNVQGLGGAYNRAQWVAAITAHYIAALEVAAIPTTFSIIQPAGRTASYFISPDRPLYSAAEFLQDLNAWCHVFSVEQTVTGITQLRYGGVDTEVLADDVDAVGQVTVSVAEKIAALRAGEDRPLDLIKVQFTADGQLEILGSALFWNNFTILTSNYSGALMGLDRSAFTTVGGGMYIQFTQDSSGTAFTDPNANDVILAGANTVAHTVRTVVPIFQSCDQRVKIAVQSDLSYASNVKVENEKEGRDRDICSAFFTNQITSEISFVPGEGISNISLHGLIYNGQHPFIKKTDHQHTWNRLLTSFFSASEALFSLRFVW